MRARRQLSMVACSIALAGALGIGAAAPASATGKACEDYLKSTALWTPLRGQYCQEAGNPAFGPRVERFVLCQVFMTSTLLPPVRAVQACTLAVQGT